MLVKAGYEIDFVSPLGGNPPVEGLDLSDLVNKKFWEDKTYHSKLLHSLTPSEGKANDYCAIFYAGGHGTVWDFPDNKAIAEIAKDKNSKNTVMLYKDVALIASVENKTLITAVEKERAKDNILTNIDSVVLL